MAGAVGSGWVLSLLCFGYSSLNPQHGFMKVTGRTKGAMNQQLCYNTVSPQLSATESALGRAGPGQMNFFTVH